MVDYIGDLASRYAANLFLICSVENIDAQNFYIKNGFEKIGIMKDLVVKDHDEIWYRKSFGTVR